MVVKMMKCPLRFDDGGVSFHRPFSAVRRESQSASRKVLFNTCNQIYLCFIKLKQQDKMKTITITIAAILALQVNVLFAGNINSYDTPVTNENSSNLMNSLAPTTPLEASFEDDATLTDYTLLAPITPTEAGFEDMPPEMTSIINLAPVTPTVANFEDDIDTITLDLIAVSPTTPAEADFE
jgi:hypothetical protein